MIELRNIKLVIWDLDNLLWEGILSEGEVRMSPERIQLIRDLTDCGIINSICSKNEWAPVKDKLKSLGIWDDFVFPSINWESKGPQIKDKLERMALRPSDVLFLDDNASNLGEARHFLPDLQVGGPEAVEELIRHVLSLERSDRDHTRLKQYKLLEQRDQASQAFPSNEDFLYASDVRVSIHHDCLAQIQRIHELLSRSNQLNYTKKRIGIEALEAVLKDPGYDCGYMTVTDRFGDYGLVGFYALREGTLEHFFFSCRTVGLQIEQWVYAQLGFPAITVIGPVRTELNQTDRPGWIHAESHSEEPNAEEKGSARILMKGPCDLSHSVVYLKGMGHIDTELTYTADDGKVISAYNHSTHIEGLRLYSPEDKKEIVKDCHFVDPAMLSGAFFTKPYDVIVLSTLIESKYRIYQKKGTDIKVAFGGKDLTRQDNWDGLQNGHYYTWGNRFDLDFLRRFTNDYVCIGHTTPKMYVAFLQKCLQWLPEKTHLCLILGSTRHYNKDNVLLQRHRELNEAVIAFAKDHPRICFIELDQCIRNHSDYEGNPDHFSTRVYYNLAQEIVRQVEAITGQKIRSLSSAWVQFDSVLLKMRKRIKRSIDSDSGLYTLMKKTYDKIYKHR